MTRSFGDAVHDTTDGIVMDVDVTPGAREEVFPDGYDPWRKRIGIRVCAPPEDGRANRAAEEAVAVFFGIAASQVHVVAGPTSRQKRLHVRGVARDTALQRLGVLA